MKFGVLLSVVAAGTLVQGAPKLDVPPFGGFLYGTQYYRSPTPLADEWETDIAKLSDSNLDMFQIRINWRNNERQEGVYTFDDVDRLMDLAERYGRKVIIKFLLECAPQYVFDRYGGTRIGPKGELLRGASHGAFYAGGWLPCFTNPKVAERVAAFVRKVAERYCGRECLIAWNAWNEPRNKPVEECFCPACRAAFGEHLRKRFGTIGKLNDFYGVCEESFERIALPAMPHGYWDIFEFKLFKSSTCIYNNLKMVYNAVRAFDKTRPIVSHVGFTSGFQNQLGDLCDDFTVSRAVDGWGTSLPLATGMATRENRLEYNRLNDFLRCVTPNYFVYEIYPGLGMFKDEYDTVWDMDYKLYDAMACGAKGLNFWQYRAERVGMENDCAGLVRMDGSPRPVLGSVRDFGRIVRELGDRIVGFYPKPAEVAIVFDYRSLLMSEVEDAVGDNYTFRGNDPVRYYADAHRGFYHLMRRNDIPVDYLNIGDLEKRASTYKVLYFPHCAMLPASAVPAMEKYVADGGVILADEGFGMRQENTWMNPYDIRCGRLMKARLAERRFGMRPLAKDSDGLSCRGYHSEYRVVDAKTVLSFADGQPAAQSVTCGKGRIVFLGFSLGYSAMDGDAAAWKRVFDTALDGLPLVSTAYGRFAEDLEERRLYKDGEQFLFLINSSNQVRKVEIREDVKTAYGRGTLDGSTAVIPPKSCLILK